MKYLEIIYKEGQPYGIRDAGGYLLFFPKVSQWDNQIERYEDEIKGANELAKKIIKSLQIPSTDQEVATNERIKKLEFMIDNGLGWKDMTDDTNPNYGSQELNK